MAKVKHYSLDRILKEKAEYNVIYGERSNGKTTAILRYALERYIASGYKDQLAIIRRWEVDFKGKNGQQMFENIVSLGWVEELTKGIFNSIYYYSQRWWLIRYDENGEKQIQDVQPFAYGFSIASEEHYKSTSFPNIKIIFFDEFISRSYYLPNEFVLFQNLLSTIIRLRDDVQIFMAGNTINHYCPYIAEMGLTNVKKQKVGTIDVYSYGDEKNPLRVAVEYSGMDKSEKKSNKYFAFDNPKLRMITNGGWEIDIYPHLPVKYDKQEIKYIYYIKFDNEILQCEIIKSKKINCWFTFIHRKTTPIKEDTKSLVFDTEQHVQHNYRIRLTSPSDDVSKRVAWFFKNEKVFYQDNDVGEMVRNYILWCSKN